MSRAIGNMAEVVVVTSVASSASRVLGVAANKSRVGLSIRNNSTAILSIFGGLAAGTEAVLAQLGPTATGIDAVWNCPANYTGPISVQHASANGFTFISEYQ